MNTFKQQKFDEYASAYDVDFTQSSIGSAQRNRVYYWLEKFGVFSKQLSVYEVNCGTGYDAQQFTKFGHTVVATDVSSGMIALAKSVRSLRVQFKTKDFFDTLRDEDLRSADILFSNFGGLNCLTQAELESYIFGINAKMKTGSKLAWVIMPKHCLMEDLYNFLRFNWGKLGQRNTYKGLEVQVGDETVLTYYHSPKEVISMLAPYFSVELVKPIAFFLPPSYLQPFFTKYPRILNFLNWLEKLFGTRKVFSSWSDHYILTATKK